MEMKILSVLCVLVAPALVHGSCDAESANRCVSGTALHSSVRNGNPSMYAYHSEADLERLCLEFTTSISSCMDREMADCGSEAHNNLMRGLKDGYHYLCTVGIQRYKNALICMGKSAVKSELEQCQATLQREMSRIKSEASSGHNMKSEFCGYVDEALKCLTGHMRQSCGQRAADFTKVYMNKIMKPITSMVNCRGNLQTRPSWNEPTYNPGKIQTRPSWNEPTYNPPNFRPAVEDTTAFGISEMNMILISAGAGVGLLIVVCVVVAVVCNRRRASLPPDSHKSPLPYSQFA